MTSGVLFSPFPGLLFCFCTLLDGKRVESFLMCVLSGTKVRVVQCEIEALFSLGLTFSSITVRLEIMWRLLLYSLPTFFLWEVGQVPRTKQQKLERNNGFSFLFNFSAFLFV